ncbi:MAG TPA: TonB-dependent receptor [Pseudomonadales bacterium]
MKLGTFDIRRTAAGASTLAVLLGSSSALAAESAADGAGGTQQVEEVVVVGRYYDAAARLVEERKQSSSVTNLIGADDIGRVGDSNVAAALRRISGLTLVNDRFVYVRGLGERYSSTTLNGARVPSVDLTRNVIPLDVFPTHVVEALEVQKSFTADQPAAFGGGNVDIRTRGLPGSLVFGLEVGTGYDDEAGGRVLSYPGGDDDAWGTDDGTRSLSGTLLRQTHRFRGEVGVQNILKTLRAQENPSATLADAQAINRQLALELNRNLTPDERDVDPDLDVKGYVGNSFFVGEDLELGFVASAAYEDGWRESNSLNRNFRFPDERTDEEVESTYTVNLTGNANVGLSYLDEHEIIFSTLYLRNTDDQTAVRTFFNENRERSSGSGFQDVRLKFEEREILVNQWRGHHRIGLGTRDIAERFLPERLVDLVPNDLEVSWFYSDSESETGIPGETRVAMAGPADPVTGEILKPAVRMLAEAADFRFTELDDRVEDYGWAVKAPLRFGESLFELSGGYRHTRQARDYRQIQYTLGVFRVGDPGLLSSPLGDVFSDEAILDPANRFELQRTGANNESYIAATMTDAWFGALDWTWRDTWRLALGVRWEDYRQFAIGYNPFGYGIANPVVTTDPDELAVNAFAKDDLFPSASLTRIANGFLAETFQLRFGYSETVTRPDLREITAASYIDPLTSDLVFGNPGVVPAELANYDIRAEWFFSNGDNFTVSLFYKDIDNPIEFFEAPSSDTNIAREIVNAESAEIYGVELELLKELAFIHPRLEPFYLQANLTFQDSALVAGEQASSPTNPKREMTNAAPFIANLQLGYDAPNGRHSATLVYNVFDERLFVAGRLGAPDGFEQPFHSLDATYAWYPTEALRVKAKIQNLLGESVEIERGGVTTFEEKAGRTFALSVSWDF